MKATDLRSAQRLRTRGLFYKIRYQLGDKAPELKIKKRRFPRKENGAQIKFLLF